MVRFFVDVEQNVVRLAEWHMYSSRQIERHIKEVGFDCDFKAMFAEDITKILLDFFCLTERGFGYAKTIVSVQAKIVVVSLMLCRR